MGTNLIRAMLLASASVAVAVVIAPVAAQAQEATYQIDIPAQSMGDALRALGKATKQNIVFSGSVVKGKRSAAVRGQMSASDALSQMLAGTGLKMSRGSGGGLVVISGNAEVAPTRVGAPTVDSNVVAMTSASSSTVVDARTGAALKGALVELMETGEKTSTGELGEFRFPGRNGSVNLRVSYLGYPEYQQFVDLKDGRATAAIYLSDGGSNNDIVVTAYQSGRAQSLNQERTADNVSTVVSSDLLGQFDGTTISDALRRAPGVGFVVNEKTGDGANVIIRGLEPGFNTVTFNGLRLPIGDGVSRGANLDNILADSVSSITINKTLLPSQDGSGTGGLVDIITKGPLDRPRFYVSLTGEKSFSAKNFLNESFTSGTISKRFGSEGNFGVSLTGQFRKRNIRSVTLSSGILLGQYFPATDEGRPVIVGDEVNPLRRRPYEEGVDDTYQTNIGFSDVNSSVTNYAIGASAQWNIGSHTELKLDYNRNHSSTDQYNRSADFAPLAGFAIAPIPELDGEPRLAYYWENYSSPGLPVRYSQSHFVSDNITSESSTLAFEGKTNTGRWGIRYRGGYAEGKTRTPAQYFMSVGRSDYGPYYLDMADLDPAVVQNTLNGNIISPFVKNIKDIVFPALTDSGYALLNDPSVSAFQFGSSYSNSGWNKRWTGAVDVDRSFNSGFLRKIQAGMFFEQSKSGSDFDGSSEIYSSLTPRELGLINEALPLTDIGVKSGFALISERNLRDFFAKVATGNADGVTTFFSPPDDLSLLDSTTEKDLAAYLQAHLKFGRLEVVGGLRAERVKTISQAAYGAQLITADGRFDFDFFLANRNITPLTGTDLTVLPRVTANFRFNDNLVLRAGYYLSIARPTLEQLSRGSNIFLDLRPRYGPNLNQPRLQVSQGNPDLKAAYTNNFDISLEWYSGDIGVMKIGAFYKPTKNAFFMSADEARPDLVDVVLPDDPRFQTPNLLTSLIRPENDTTLAKVWGAEVSIERRLNFLPGLLSGLGLYANYTYSDSSRLTYLTFRFAEGGRVYVRAPFQTQPKHTGTFALTYSKGKVDGTLGYTMQSKYLTNFGQAGLSSYKDGIGTLDGRIEYKGSIFGSTARIYIEGSNLLKSAKDATFSRSAGGDGVPKILSDQTYNGGRTVRLGATISF